MYAYPAALEHFWLARARQVTGENEPFAALEKIRPAVQRLSDLFTTARPEKDFPDYAADPLLRTAYGLFFFPQSFLRARIALDQALRFRDWRPAPSDTWHILDLGSGPAPCGLALASTLRELAPAQALALTALDHSPAALQLLRELAPTILPERFSLATKVTNLRNTAHQPDDLPKQDLIVIGFAANEIIGTDAPALQRWLLSLRRLLKPGGLLLVLEPALQTTATTLQRAADALANGPDLFRWAPELSGSPCPLLAEGKHWSHEVRRWAAPESAAFLNRQLFRDLSVLKFAYTALGTQPPPALPSSPQLLRLVSPLEALKGRFVFSAVTTHGEKITVDIPSRGLSKNEIKRHLIAWERGDIAAVKELHPLGLAGNFRIASIHDFTPVYQILKQADLTVKGEENGQNLLS